MNDIIISDICKSFEGKKVLDNFSAVLKKGELTSLMAPSGGGKTTLLRIIMGLIPADSGSITGLDGLSLSAVFQEDRLCPALNPVDNIRLVNKDVTKEEASRALSLVGLSDCLLQRTEELSGGMKRRVVILRALLAKYDLLLLDEPFKGLDKDSKELVMSDTLKRVEGKTVLLVTHDAKELDYMGIKNRLYL